MKVADDNELNLLQNIFAYFNAFSDCNILQSMSCKHDFLRLKWHCHSEPKIECSQVQVIYGFQCLLSVVTAINIKFLTSNLN